MNCQLISNRRDQRTTSCLGSQTVAVENAVEQILGCAFVYIGLAGRVVEHTIKGENLILDLLRRR